jgi:hypothetical protein
MLPDFRASKIAPFGSGNQGKKGIFTLVLLATLLDLL